LKIINYVKNGWNLDDLISQSDQGDRTCTADTYIHILGFLFLSSLNLFSMSGHQF